MIVTTPTIQVWTCFRPIASRLRATRGAGSHPNHGIGTVTWVHAYRARTALQWWCGKRWPQPSMPYVITEPCIGVKDTSCVDVCPVDCIHGREDDPQLYIDPEVCIDCGACVSACPVEAIYAEADVPEKWTEYVKINAEYFERQPERVS